MLSLVLAASLVIFSGGSDAPPPYTVDQSGITLPAGDTFRDNGHVNIRADKPHNNLHFEGKCVTRTDAECAGQRHEAAQYIGKSFIPWSAFGLTGEFCVPWVQISHYDEHFGEGKDDHGNPVKPVCIKLPPVEEPTPDPTDEPSEEPTEEPTVEPTPDPTDEPSEEPTPDPTTDTPTEEPTPNPTTDTPVTPDPTEEPTPWTPTPSPSSSQPSVPEQPESPSSPTPSSPAPSPTSVPVSGSLSTPSTSTSDSSRSAVNTSVVEQSGPPAKTEQENLASTGSSSVAGPILLGLVFAFGGAYLLRRSRLGRN